MYGLKTELHQPHRWLLTKAGPCLFPYPWQGHPTPVFHYHFPAFPKPIQVTKPPNTPPSQLIQPTSQILSSGKLVFCQEELNQLKGESKKKHLGGRDHGRGSLLYSSIRPSAGFNCFLGMYLFFSIKMTTKCEKVKSRQMHIQSVKSHSRKYCRLKYRLSTLDDLIIWIV